jgi:hypothetical protein
MYNIPENKITSYVPQMMVDYGLSKDMYDKIVEYMAAHVREFVDGCGEVSATVLAEWCADKLGHNEWLDEETHPVWDLACDFATCLEDDIKNKEA